MGRPRKTLYEHLQAGSFRWDRQGNGIAGDAAREVVPPTKPRGLAGAAGKLWDVVAARLAGVVSESDAAALTMLCRLWAEWQRIEKALRKAEPGSVEHGRLMRALSASSSTFGTLAVRFGLDPVSREKLPPPTLPAADDEESRRAQRDSRFFGRPASRVKVRQKTKLDLEAEAEAEAKRLGSDPAAN